MAKLFEAANDEWLVQLEGNLFRQSTLMQMQLRTDNNDGTAGVIDTLSEQVLTETSLFSFERS